MTAGANLTQNKPEMAEILVKWQVPGNIVQPDAKKQLLHILVELMMSYPEEITLVDHKRREWSYNPKDSEAAFVIGCDEISLQIHPIRNKEQKVIKWVAITKINTSRPMAYWKDNDHFYPQMIEAKIYMFPHPFGYDEWDVSSIGFIKNIHVTHHTKEHLHETLLQTIKNKKQHHLHFNSSPNVSPTKIKLPLHELTLFNV